MLAKFGFLCDTEPVATQAERRTATMNRLVDATIGVLDEIGYAGASTQIICDRAGVSQGGMFRHYATRRALMAHAAREVAQRQVAVFREHLPANRSIESPADVRSLVADVVALGASPENRTWHELMAAARTDSELREELQDATDFYHREIMAVAAELLSDVIAPDDLLPTMRVILSFVDGLAVATPLTHDQAGIDAAVDTFARMLWAFNQENA